jgi:hypothetical protein
VLSAPHKNFLPKISFPGQKIIIIFYTILAPFWPFFGKSKENWHLFFFISQIFFRVPFEFWGRNVDPLATLRYERIEMAESFSAHDDEKITKEIVHCEERPAPCNISNEKCTIFSNSVA